ncbi:carboxylesterase family protein [Sphingomonas aerolata]
MFAQAIQESGTPGFGVAPRTLVQNERLGERLIGAAGLPDTAPTAQLRNLSVDKILEAQDAVDVPDLDDDSFIWLQAVIDGRVLTDTPAKLLASGRFARKPLVIGVNAKELPLHGGRAAAEATVRREFGAGADRALDLYGLQRGGTPVDDPRLGDVTAQIADDVTFRCPTIAVSKAFARVGVPVWQYQFDYAPAGGTVSHASEISYVFNPPQPGQPPLQRYWVNFVRTGNPNSGGLPLWARYSADTRAYMAFEQTGPAARRDLRGPICTLRDIP